MPEFTGKEPFKERIDIILDELSLGIRWERPSLILVVYRSEFIKKAIQSNLVESLGESGQAVCQYSVDKSHYDIPVDLKNHPNRRRTVYFVSGLQWGGGRGYSNAYRALNMHREYLIEGNIRVIFWLTKKEVKQCSKFSPDFWAFRHKVVEFLELPSKINNRALKSSIGSIHNLYTRKGTDFQMGIAAAEQFYGLGCIDDAILNYRKTLHMYPDQTAINLQIAEIYLSMGRVPAAKRILIKEARGKMHRVNFLRELTHLKQAANSIHLHAGGFYEYFV
jgi:hypothetical protein